jgi:type II secretory pathway pseudopilin PulG
MSAVYGLRPRGASARGFTLIEVVVAGAILVLVIGAALLLFVDTQETVNDSMQVTDVAVRASRLDAQLRTELRNAGQLSLGATSGGVFVAGANGVSQAGAYTSIQYRLVTSFDTSTTPPTAVYGELRELRFAYDAGEAGGTVGADDDDDGRADEGTVSVFVDGNGDDAITADEQAAVLGLHVSGADFAFALPSGLEARNAADLELVVTVTVVIRAGVTGTADGTTGEQRVLRIPLRNR